MHLPQIILIAIYAVSLGVHLAIHGKPREGNNNIGYALVSTALVFGLLIWGGFFTD